MHDSVTPLEERWAYMWFFGVGALAICIATALATIDQNLTNSDREVRLNNTLKEVRSAQASFETRNLDRRMLVAKSVDATDK
jgi:hypothetical protein